MANGIPFSAFPVTGNLRTTDVSVGLRGSLNYRFLNTGVNDSGGSPIITYSQPVGPGVAVNYIDFLSAFTGNEPTISAKGTDTNVNLGLQGQGTGYVDLLGTGIVKLPVGTTAQRPATPVVGGQRYNTDSGFLEYYDGIAAAWEPLATFAGVVTSILGTANQITASSPTGDVTLSIPSNPIFPGIPSFINSAPNLTSTASAAGTTAMTSSSTYWQILTGVTTQTYTLPNATTLRLGTSYFFTNDSTGTATINDNTGGLVATVLGGGAAIVVAKNIGSAAGSWDSRQSIPSTGILGLAQGGTGAALTANNGGVFYSTATAGAILAGTATAHQVLLSGATAAPTWSTATYPVTTTINRLLYSSANNVIADLATANNGVLTTGTSGTPVITALGTDGQLIIGSSAGAPAAATITAGTNVTITNGHNSITIAAAGNGTSLQDTITQVAHGFSVQQLVYISGASTYALAEANSVVTAEVVGIVTNVASANVFTLTTSGYCTGLAGLTAGTVYFLSDATPGLLTATAPTAIGSVNKPVFVADTTTSGYFINYRGELISGSTWIDQTTTPVTMAVNSSYIADNAGVVTFNLPATAAQGSTFEIVGQGAGGWLIQCGAAQVIKVGSATTNVAGSGSVASTNRYNTVNILCVVANTTFVARYNIGNLTLS